MDQDNLLNLGNWFGPMILKLKRPIVKKINLTNNKTKKRPASSSSPPSRPWTDELRLAWHLQQQCNCLDGLNILADPARGRPSSPLAESATVCDMPNEIDLTSYKAEKYSLDKGRNPRTQRGGYLYSSKLARWWMGLHFLKFVV